MIDAIHRRLALIAAAIVGLAALAPAAGAQPISYRDSFRIGSGSGLLCAAQALLADPALNDIFDRGYAVVCRDAAVPVGHLYALRVRGDDPLQRLAVARAGRADCRPGATVDLAGVGAVETLDCRLAGADLAYRVYVRRGSGIVHVAEGLGGYDSALQLGLSSIVTDREVEGQVSVAITGAGDPAAFARAQAGALDPQRALAEAYRRNNAGSYAEAAEFFARLTARDESPAGRAEALVNEGLQKSNLGRYAEAESLFDRAAALAGSEPVTARRLRNYRAMHMLNQGRAVEALAELDRPVPPLSAADQLRQLVIDEMTAAQLSAESPGASRIAGAEGLTPLDKAMVLDGQALQLRGTVMRLQGRGAEAVAPLNQALEELVAIREGRIAATVWMRAQIMNELASLAEERGDAAEAERLHGVAVKILSIDYPDSPALLSAKGRQAAFLSRLGRGDEAAALYREIVEAVAAGADTSVTLRPILAPYFEYLVQRGDRPEAVADLFAASQALVRPGVAQTQAVLARELSAGSDEAARLFRQSVDLARDIERSRVELGRIEDADTRTAADEARAQLLRSALERLGQDQVATQARLAEFPQYRAVAGNAISLAEVQQLLGPGEAYYKMLTVSDDAYGIFITRDAARAFRIGATPAELEREVDGLRATISIVENGQQLTYPFDIELAWRMYQQLFSPIHAELAAASHLIFEPDGALLRLPPNLLVMDRAGVDAYLARAADPDDEGFDFRGVEWVGRNRDVSTAVSARAFRDVRRAPPSDAVAEYIGFGQNEPARAFLQPAASRDDCAWPLLAWNRPISAAELFAARQAIGAAGAGGADIVTGAAFTDTAIQARSDLDRYRVLHFATHGLVSAPRPECPARPALLTSFGGPESDGLLTFAEIFDLRLDADLVILSACDTAGHGSRAALEEAGLATGGDLALDGLVRAFVGAGGRLVVASHWPVPDDFNATQRLITGMFQAPPGTGTAAALRIAQRALMEDADTSHPYYWSGFAVVGDGAAPVVRRAGGGSAQGR